MSPGALGAIAPIRREWTGAYPRCLSAVATVRDRREARLRRSADATGMTLEFDERDLLRLAVLGDRKVLGGQTLDGIPVLILDRHRLDDQPGLAPEDRLLRSEIGEIKRLDRRQGDQEDKNPENGSRASEPHPQAGQQFPHLVRAIRQSELRAADDRIEAGVGDAIQHVRRVEAPVHRPPVADAGTSA